MSAVQPKALRICFVSINERQSHRARGRLCLPLAGIHELQLSCPWYTIYLKLPRFRNPKYQTYRSFIVVIYVQNEKEKK